MNTTLETETVAPRDIACSTIVMCLLAFSIFSAGAVCFARTPTPLDSALVQTQTNTAGISGPEAEPPPTIPPEELEALVAPIALYPDPLLIQVLAASTYPLEIVQLKQWMDENKKLKAKTLAEAVLQQNWDPSVQALSAFPAVVNKLANKIQWTTNLGNAFLAQQDDVMDAVQRLREKAQANGTLKTNDKQTVTTETTNTGEQAITIEPAQRDVVYVPTYNTETVYGDSGYSDYSGYSGYADYSGSNSGYDYSYIGYAVAAAAEAAYSYYWGEYNWRDRYGYTNGDNYYNKNYSKNWNNNGNNWNNKVNNSTNNASNLNRSVSNSLSRLPTQAQGAWQHNPAHRGNVPYGSSNLANRYGQGNNGLSGAAANRASQPATTRAANQLAQGNRLSQSARGNAGNQAARGNLSRPPQGARPSTRPPGGSAPNRVGNRMPSNWPNSARGGAFGPSNGNLARAFGGRGAQSLGPQGGFRGGPPHGLNAGGPPMGGGLHGGPPGGGFHGGPPGGGFPGGGPPMGGPPMGGPPMGGPPMGGPPMGGAPPPPPGP